MRHPQLDAILAEVKTGLTALYGEQLSQIILFGSQARGDALPDSDIDLALVFHENKMQYFTNWPVATLLSDVSLKYDTTVSCIALLKEEFEQRTDLIIRNLKNEGSCL